MSKLLDIQSKISSLEVLKKTVTEWKKAGEKIVFTNGCFDILHQGHVCYLAKAADCGSKLVVAVNTDASVKAQNKGSERPINPENARLLVLASLAVVDAVILFDEDTPLHLIQELVPNVLVKGADYDADQKDAFHKQYIVGREVVLTNGGSVRTIELEAGFSTTSIVTKLKSS